MTPPNTYSDEQLNAHLTEQLNKITLQAAANYYELAHERGKGRQNYMAGNRGARPRRLPS
jgi:hypothetical protein